MALFTRRGRCETLWTTTPHQPGAVAIEISQAELQQIARLLRQAWWHLRYRDRRAPSIDPVPEMMRAWQIRRGIADGLAESHGLLPTGRIPFYESEIKNVENAIGIIGHSLGGPDTCHAHRELLAELHARLGYALVTGHHVSPPAIPTLISPYAGR